MSKRFSKQKGEKKFSKARVLVNLQAWHCRHGPARTFQHNEAARPENKGERLFQRIPAFAIEKDGETSEVEAACEEPAGFWTLQVSPAQWAPGACTAGIRKEDPGVLGQQKAGLLLQEWQGPLLFLPMCSWDGQPSLSYVPCCILIKTETAIVAS